MTLQINLKNHDWKKTLRDAEDAARDNKKADAVLKDYHIGWELLREAAHVSRIAFRAPPRSGWPTSSSMPDAPDDVTQWQLMSAYLKGDLESLPSSETKPSRPSAEQIDRAEVILYLWHHHALNRKGDRSRIKKAVYSKACGLNTQKIASITGLTVRQIRSAQVEAAQDIVAQINKYTKFCVDMSFS